MKNRRQPRPWEFALLALVGFCGIGVCVWGLLRFQAGMAFARQITPPETLEQLLSSTPKQPEDDEAVRKLISDYSILASAYRPLLECATALVALVIVGLFGMSGNAIGKWRHWRSRKIALAEEEFHPESEAGERTASKPAIKE